MFFRRPEYRRTAAVAIACLVSTTLIAADKASGWGRKAIIRWVDESGNEKEADARRIRYGYWERTYLTVERNGKRYKDKERRIRGLPIAGNFIRFVRIKTIGFEWTQSRDSGDSILALKVTQRSDKIHIATGNELAGALHPRSPYISFVVDGVEHRIDLAPLMSEEERRDKPRLLGVAFYL